MRDLYNVIGESVFDIDNNINGVTDVTIKYNVAKYIYENYQIKKGATQKSMSIDSIVKDIAIINGKLTINRDVHLEIKKDSQLPEYVNIDTINGNFSITFTNAKDLDLRRLPKKYNKRLYN